VNYSHKDVFLLVLNCFLDEAGHFLNYGIMSALLMALTISLTEFKPFGFFLKLI